MRQLAKWHYANSTLKLIGACAHRTVVSGVNMSVTNHVGLCGLQGAGDGGGASPRHVAAQTLLYVTVQLLQHKQTEAVKQTAGPLSHNKDYRHHLFHQ